MAEEAKQPFLGNEFNGKGRGCMPGVTEVRKRLEGVFAPPQAAVLAEVIIEAYTALVKTSDFNELKEIVRNLGIKMEELAEAQKRTEEELRKLAGEHLKTREQLGGLSTTVGYQLMNRPA